MLDCDEIHQSFYQGGDMEHQMSILSMCVHHVGVSVYTLIPICCELSVSSTHVLRRYELIVVQSRLKFGLPKRFLFLRMTYDGQYRRVWWLQSMLLWPLRVMYNSLLCSNYYFFMSVCISEISFSEG